MAEAITRAVLARIPDDDPVWQAALQAPVDLTPDTEEEIAALEEVRRGSMHSVPGEHVSAAIAVRRRREG
jgi:hypothetical protein